MSELRLIAVSEDGAHLVLRDAGGKKFLLPVDDRLRAAIRGDRARMGQIETESQLRPREIQARIRAGETAEEVAATAGIPVDRVRRFEGPVLAERVFMAERAQATPVRRQGEGNGPLLGRLVADRLMREGIDPDGLRWDSWRRDDGCWEVILSYEVEGVPASARWIFDPPRRLIVPDDGEAVRLTGEAPAGNAPAHLRLASVPPAGPLGAGAPVAGVPPYPEDEDDLDAMLVAIDGEQAAEPAPPVRRLPPVAQVPRVVAPHRERLTGTTDRQAESDGVRPGRRATVPTWDEIMFGSASRRRKRQEP